MKQQKRLLQFLIIMLLLLSVTALAQISASVLTSGTWMFENSTINFKDDGSGTFTNNSGKTFEMSWEQNGDQINVDYQFYGKRHLALTATEENDTWVLTDEDGNIYSIGGSVAQEESNAYAVAFDQEIDLGFAKITFSRIQMLREMHPSGTNGSYTTAADGTHYFALVCKLTNTSTGSLEVGNLLGEVMLNQYVYDASAKADYNGTMATSVAPMTESTYYIFATVPDTLISTASSGEVKFAFNDSFIGKPANFGLADFAFSLSFDSEAIASAWLEPERDITYFAECPALPMPSSFAEVNQVSKFDLTDYYRYTYSKILMYDEQEDLYERYRDGLTNNNYAINEHDDTFQVYSGSTKIAEVSRGSFGWIEIEIPKGLSGFATKPTPGTVTTVPVSENLQIKIGTTISPKNVSMTLADTGITDAIYSSLTPNDGRYYYYEPDSGDHLFYLHGMFNNVGGSPLDIRHIYAEIIFDDTYHYEASSVGAKTNATAFINTVAAQSSCDYYIFASVPASVLSKYKTCTIKLGFTEDFDIMYVQNNLPDFSHCDTVYEIVVK